MKLQITPLVLVLLGVGQLVVAGSPPGPETTSTHSVGDATGSAEIASVGVGLLQPRSLVQGKRSTAPRRSRIDVTRSPGEKRAIARLPATDSDIGSNSRPLRGISPGSTGRLNALGATSKKHSAPTQTRAGTLPDNVVGMVNERINYAIGLAGKGALFAAEEEFQRVLWMLAQAQDEAIDTDKHTEALNAALVALDEAEDFVESMGPSRTSSNVRQLAEAHETPVIRQRESAASPFDALRGYYGYAQEHLLVALADAPVASRVLDGLARVQLAQAQNDRSLAVMASAKAIAFYQVALDISPSSHEVANELGVLLARYGRLEPSRKALLQGLSQAESPEAWLNLSKVHERLGDHQAARDAKARSVALRKKTTAASESVAGDTPHIRWVAPELFASQATNADLITREQQSVSVPPPVSNAKKADEQPRFSKILKWFPSKRGNSPRSPQQVSRQRKAKSSFDR